MSEAIKLQLNTAVSNPEGLKKSGELILDLVFSGTGTDCTKLTIGSTLANMVEVELTSGSFFAEQNGTTNQGSTKTLGAGSNVLYFKVAQDSKLIIKNVGYVNTFIEYVRTANSPIISVDFSEFKYARSIVTLATTLSFTGVINDLRLLTNMGNLSLFNSNLIKGDLSVVENMPNITAIQLYTVGITGSISSLANLVNLKTLNLSGTSVGGDLSVLSPLTQLTSIVLNATFVQGDASVIRNKPSLSALNLDGITSGITWESSSPCSQTALIYVYIADCILSDEHLNNALISLSSAVFTGQKSIRLKANVGYILTGGGNTAVSSLKANGVSININGTII